MLGGIITGAIGALSFMNTIPSRVKPRIRKTKPEDEFGASMRWICFEWRPIDGVAGETPQDAYQQWLKFWPLFKAHQPVMPRAFREAED